MSFDHFVMTINGQKVTGSAGLDVLNPATEDVIATVPDASKAQLDEAVAAAKAAFPAWAALSMDERRAKIRAIADRIQENKAELARIFTAEQGRPYGGAEWEVDTASQWCHGVAQFDLPVEVIEDSEERRVEIRHTPIGVVGAIAPWNAPLLMAIWKLAPALLAGNTMVLKPSPYTPLTTLKLGELLLDILPPGVLNIVSGGNALGQWITDHPDIGKVSFTGSTATGKRVMESAAKTLKRITLELGGNDAAIVLPDVDPKAVAPALFWGAFFNSAQVCVAIKRLYIHSSIYDAVAHELVEFAKTVTVGDGSQQGVDLGPVQNRMQFEKVKNLLEDARANGQTFLTGGEVSDGPGYFIPISIVDNPPEKSRVVTEEAFGPVLPLLKYDDLDDVIARANDSESGLGGSIWSNDVDKARAIGQRLQTGTVWINEMFAFLPNAPFGGHKQSGVGVEHGMEGLLEFTNTQTMTSRKPAPAG
ncbi:aldehyde dehydrogenase family protein [Sphingobium subterraneum]|uniref:Acyl-CoA reductase-like NAD-dependent aldehyde dehydrogenase n=1 Tax=Sphingobium subterraneum TaxID=627688 RepID=A0A841J4X9_9SPHN|nr:aldehyde dehydrogenase family protein [Sphingobium subterraneum]MBB6123625.1 acyl-CoA reductase-like NAD-dependent aldehyde dehydrogenase [Sphingobium subterraneum]